MIHNIIFIFIYKSLTASTNLFLLYSIKLFFSNINFNYTIDPIERMKTNDNDIDIDISIN